MSKDLHTYIFSKVNNSQSPKKTQENTFFNFLHNTHTILNNFLSYNNTLLIKS